MKNQLIIFVLIMAFATLLVSAAVTNPRYSTTEVENVKIENPIFSAFCEGWENGYEAGYCYGKYGCLSPLIPLCPLPRLGESSYKDGYNRGFLAGKAKQESY